MVECVKYPVLQVRPSGLLIYERVEWYGGRWKRSESNLGRYLQSQTSEEDRNKEFYTGVLTPYAKKRLKKAIELLVASSEWKEAIQFKTGHKFKFKVNFITLTLPAPQGNVSDKELKKTCLDNWIKRAKRKYGLKSYVWRAERQKNGNLHFHIISDCYIRYDHIRDDWNAVLSKWHFIDAFRKKHGHCSPNSTDVHAVHKINDLAAYMIKYMSKDSDKQDTVEGKIWDCSSNLKTRDKCEMWLDSEEEKVWENALNDNEVKVVGDDRWTMLCLNGQQFDRYVQGKVRVRYEKFLSRVRDG